MSSVENHIDSADTDPAVRAQTALGDTQRRLLWEYVECGPERWRVPIGRVASDA